LGFTHYIPIAVVIIAFMPLKQRLEHAIGAIFEKKKIEFIGRKRIVFRVPSSPCLSLGVLRKTISHFPLGSPYKKAPRIYDL